MRHIFPAALFSLLIILTVGCQANQDTIPEGRPDQAPEAVLSFPGRIVFQSNADGDNEIYMLISNGLKQLTENTWNDEYPVWSPDGTRIAFSSDRSGSYGIYIMQADGRETFPVIDTDADEKEPAWFPEGDSLAFSRETKKLLGRATRLQRVDLSTGRTESLIPQFKSSHGIAHISPQGLQIVFTGKRTIGWDVALWNPAAGRVAFLEDKGKSCRARFSKDGQRLAYVSSTADGKGDIWMMSPDGSQKIRLTLRDQTYDYFPAWSPDGRFIVFNSSIQHDHDGDWQLYMYNLQEKTVHLLYDSPGNDTFPDWH